VLAAMGWGLLNEPDAAKPVMEKSEQAGSTPVDESQFAAKIFYAFTFPITAGSGAVVVMLTLTAHASVRGLIPDVLFPPGNFLRRGRALHPGLSLLRLHGRDHRANPSADRSRRPRIIAFVLLCIGVQITSNSAQSLLKILIR
jgi:multiple antibiotic resistance protein